MIVVKTPLRISFTGGGTDFYEHFKNHQSIILTSTINKYIYIILKKRIDDYIYLNYSSKEVVANSKKIKHEIFKTVLNYFEINNGIEISVISDIPSKGSGLGSSSAFTACLIKACCIYKGIKISKKKLAELTCHIEINLLKKPIGIQDQYAVSFGGLNILKFNKKLRTVKKVKSKLIYNIIKNNSLLLNLEMPRLSETVLKNHSKLIKNNKTNLINLCKNSEILINSLNKLNINKFCKAINIGWNEKKKLVNNISNKFIESEIINAIKYGCIGYKVCGAGNGGYLLLIFKSKMLRRDFYEKNKKKCLLIEIENDGTKKVHLKR